MNVGSDYKPVRGDMLRGPDRREWVVNQVVETPEGTGISIITPPVGRFPGQGIQCLVSYVRDWVIVDKAKERRGHAR